MPLRSPKMYSFIFGFQRRVWWPKWTPASSSSFMVSVATGRLLTFRPLEALARALLAVLLPLLHARVAGEEAAAAELGLQLGVGQGQRPRQSPPHPARPAPHAPPPRPPTPGQELPPPMPRMSASYWWARRPKLSASRACCRQVW